MIPGKVKLILLAAMVFSSCGTGGGDKQKNVMQNFKEGSFGSDVSFLQKRDSIIILKSQDGKGQLIVSAKYQGKVFTSTAEGPDGQSFGWINYKAFDQDPDPHMNAYGGENRLWLGPEGGKYSVYFKPGAPMDFANWKTPAPIDTEAWDVVAKDDQKVTLQKLVQLKNYVGTDLQLKIERSVAIQSTGAIQQDLNIKFDTAVKAVGYQTFNTLTNTGTFEWTEQTGMPCLWMLDMFKPSPQTTIVIPYKKGAAAKEVATTDYFGEIPADRIRLDNGILYFRADGKSRGKLGIKPPSATRVAGSYDAVNKVLTITTFTVENEAPYLNQEWNTKKPVFSGDAVNAYNDGPLEDGSQMGPFYEIESVSPAAQLKPGASLQHQHNVYHFTGDEAQLSRISSQLLGVSINDIQKVFHH